MDDKRHERTFALLGGERLALLGGLHVAIVGVGGVGGWCAEALARSGVRRLSLLDDDLVAPSNLNRQCCALESSLGLAKVEAMKKRLLAIDSALEVEARRERFLSISQLLGTEASRPDVIVDAIDSVACKAELVLGATAAGIPIYSSLGAAKRFDPTKVALKRFSRVEGDGLARAMRQRFKRLGRFPAADFLCAVSSEPPAETEGLGSMMPVPAAFGLALASAVIGDVRA